MKNQIASSTARRAAVAGALMVATTGLTFAGTMPAEAHQVCDDFGRNWGCVSSNHQTVSAHDEQCDNQYFYTQYRTTEVPGANFTLTDRNGCRQPGAYVSVTPYRVTAIRVCSPINDCKPWRIA